MLERVAQNKPPTPPSTQGQCPDLTDHKRKREQKGKEVMEGGKDHLSKDVEPQKRAKQARVTQTVAKKREVSRSGF